MVYAQSAIHNLGTAQVVHGKVGAALVLVLEKGESFRLSRLLVADEVHKRWLTKLREYGNDISFRKFIRQAAYVDIGSVSIVGVP